MLTLFLVEDEIIELDLLREHFDWTGMGIRVVGSAKNGKTAWEQIQSLQPDIVLTDVKMPIMDGLQLASLIQERFDWMKIVFLSGHDEFSYVKSALSAGAVGYLLKPVDSDELSGVIAKIKDEVMKADFMRRSKQMLADKQIGDILRGGGSESGEQAWHELTRMAPEYLNILYVSANIQIDDHELLPETMVKRLKEQEETSKIIRSTLDAFSLKGSWIRLDAYRWFLVIPTVAGRDWASFWLALSDAIRKQLQWTATIGVCGKERILGQAGDMCKEAEKAVEERFYVGPGSIIYFEHVREKGEAIDVTGLETLETLPERMTLSGLPQTADEVGPYFDRLRELRVPRDKVYRLAADLLKGISDALSKYEDRASRGIGEQSDWNQDIARLQSISGIEIYVLGLLGRISRYLEDKQRDRQTVLVQQVAEIIDSEYSKALTIEYLAGRVYLSPNYLRALFKEKKGCTVHEYLTRARLKKAVELLRDKTLKIHDVARKVGYDNTSYFCSFFYKSQGVTPNEYRKKFL